MFSSIPDAGKAAAVPIKLDPVSLVLHASGPVFVVVWSLVAAAALVWVIAVLKLLQVSRLSSAELRFEVEAAAASAPDELFALARRHGDAPGARVVLELAKRAGSPRLLESVARRALVDEQQRASSLMPTLSSIAAASPFVGLFGTVYGIMDAFLRIGQEKSASLPVVAPAIGEALIATAIGLFAAIPAVVAYNAISKRIDDLLSALDAASAGWVVVAADVNEPAPMPLARPSVRPPHPPPIPRV
jgi:biopolymer transport protein TolQ